VLTQEYPLSLRDVLVCLDQSEGALGRLRLSADLAARHGSQLSALYVREWNVAQLRDRGAAEMGLISAGDLKVMRERIERSIDATAERLRAVLADLGQAHHLHTEWRCVDGSTTVVVPQQARCADLCIVGHQLFPDANAAHYSPSELLFVSGRPVLFIPDSGGFRTLGRHVVVAWDASRTAARALNDALPLIERADRTTLLMVRPPGNSDSENTSSATRMVDHLRKHAQSVDLVEVESIASGSIGDTLQAQADVLNADLVVAGAFGHSKMLETVLGGVTRDLLARMRVPIFMAH
jgi:nucleotide-binding universal stress UspA family protein